jgi:hypothetical protein
MQLVADRFVVRDGEDGRACDLASGSDVVLVVGSAGGVSDQLRWTDRCGTLRALQHHAIAPLVDFGLLGEASRFEAWSCGPAWAGAAQVSASTRDRVKQFVNAAGLSSGELADGCVRAADDGTTRCYEAGMEPAGADDGAADTPLRVRGLGIIERRAVCVLAEMFHGGGCRPWPRSADRRVREADRRARACALARMRGFVPIASRLVASRYSELWRGRSLFILGDEADAHRWPHFSTWPCATPNRTCC